METKEENQSDSKKKKKLLESNRLLSATALFVSVSTLFILLYQSHLSNKMYELENKALKTSVMPILTVSQSLGPDYYTIYVSNLGIGPAIIKSFHVQYRDSVYEADIPTLIWKRIIKSPDTGKPFYYGHSNIGRGGVIPVNGRIEHISANDTATAVGMHNTFIPSGESPALNIAISYTSIYEDETWTAYLFGPFTIPPKSGLATLP